jgi:hypothetical protein
MSTKTNFKRIALVAVAALGAGVLSVAPANAGAVAAGNADFDAAATQPGVCKVTNGTNAGTTSAVVLAGGTFKLTVVNGVDTNFVSVSGNATIESATAAYESVTTTTATDAQTASSSTITFRAGAVGSAKISLAPSATGTVVDTLGVTIVAACAADSYSASKSYVAAITQAESKDNAAEGNNIDSTGATTVVNGSNGYVGIALADAYGDPLATSGAMVATITSGDAFVNVQNEANGTDTTAGKAKTAVLATVGSKAVVTVSQAVADKPTVAVVSVTFNGTVVATKTFTMQGVASSIAVKGVSVGKVGSVGVFQARVLDAAGNALFSKTVTNDSTANGTAAISAITSGVTADATSGADGDWSAATQGQFGCTTGGVTTLNMRHVVDTATVVKASTTIACGGALDTWTISMDKATYAPGEIATLTVAGKDSKGNAVNSTDTLGTVEYSFGGMTAVTAPTSADKFTSAAGAKTYTFSVGTSEGAFVGTFKIAGATDTAAKTVQYKVAGAAGVSNADVLKAIVSLIASINKQIAALQKALLRR